MEDIDYNTNISSPSTNIDDVYKTATFRLFSINLGMYIITSIIGGSIILTGRTAVILFGISSRTLFKGWIWTPITSIFAHGSISHLGFNMIYLLIFGFRLEERNYSKNGIYLMYLITGVLSGVLSMLIFFTDNSVSLGASGAVFGLLGVNVGIEKKNNDPNYKKVLYMSVILFVFSGVSPNTNIFAHLLGLLFGYYLGKSDYIENYNLDIIALR
ncbi:MAG: rhomboid family intramembrane serine protease [Candidatus Kariarchaeaceae archaeon]|jgi:rhomboid protease GluP